MKKFASSILVIGILVIIAIVGWWLVGRLIESDAASLFQARTITVSQAPITWTIQPQIRDAIDPPTELQLGTGMIQFNPEELYFFGESVRRIEPGGQIVVEAQASDWLLYFLREGDVIDKRVNYFDSEGWSFFPAVFTDLSLDLETGRMRITITAWDAEDLWPYHSEAATLAIDIPFWYREREGSAYFTGPTIEFEFAQARTVPGNEVNYINDISHIPYFGNREVFRLSGEHALAYAEAIRSAELDIGWGHFSFDTLSLVLIDVFGDGIPLLLLAERDATISWGNAYWNILFGFADGSLQQITDYPTGIGIATVENENLLALVNWSNFSGMISLYRVRYGAAELISKTHYFNDWHNGAFYIDDIEVSEDEFWRAIEELSIEHLMEKDHPGTIHPLPSFVEYLTPSVNREQAVQIFIDYAAE